MKSAAAVFGNYELFNQKSADTHLLRNPHYYPSNNKDLGENSKKIGLTQRYIDPAIQKGETVDGDNTNEKEPESLESLISFISNMDNMDSGSSKYNESWPTGEQDSLQKRTDGNFETANKEHSIEDFLEQQDGKENKKTLSKFLQRFREQPPLPRNERAPMKKRDTGGFWWLSSPSKQSSSTPNSNDSTSFTIDLNSASSSPTETDKGSVTPSGQSNPKKPHSRYLFEEDSDSVTDRIQLRTEKLLQLSENVVKDTTSSTNSSSRNVLPAKYNSISAKVKGIGTLGGSASDVSNVSESSSHVYSTSSRPLRPEDDILYKWRLSHRMNMAAKTISINPFLDNKETEHLRNTKQQVEQNARKSTVDKPKDCNIETIDENKKDHISELDGDALGEKIAGDSVVSRKTDCKHESEYRSVDHDTCDCYKDNSCSCCQKVCNDSMVHHGCKMSHCQRFNTFCYHIPPVVHLCDSTTTTTTTSHHHPNHQLPQHESEEIEKEETDEDLRKPPDKKQNIVIDKRKRESSVVDNFSNQNVISPVIHQETNRVVHELRKLIDEVNGNQTVIIKILSLMDVVITDHLFDTHDESIETCSNSSPSINKQNGSRDVPIDDGCSSEDEFHDDEILRELRNRRKDIKDELKLVCHHLNQLHGS